MAFFDLPLEQLQKYRAPDTEPRDFDAFWKKTLAETTAHPLAARFVPVQEPIYKTVNVYDVTFGGYLGQKVRGWFIEPLGVAGKLPCLVNYMGYSGGRSLPVDHMQPAAAGFAHLVMDTRGQGWSSPGDTGDEAPGGHQVPGMMTRGVLSPATYYYRRLFTDAARAVQAAAAHPRVDPKRIGVMGGSQGGGITIAAAALAGGQVKVAMPDVPFLCHYRRATAIVDSMPYHEITQYLKCHRDQVDQVYATLAYFDGVNFAPRIKARCLFSVGLMDMTCPPSTVYAAYNAVKAKKEIRVYSHNTHEGGGPFQMQERARFAAEYL